MEYYIDTSLHQFFIYNGFKTERKSMSYQKRKRKQKDHVCPTCGLVGWHLVCNEQIAI